MNCSDPLFALLRLRSKMHKNDYAGVTYAISVPGDNGFNRALDF